MSDWLEQRSLAQAVPGLFAGLDLDGVGVYQEEMTDLGEAKIGAYLLHDGRLRRADDARVMGLEQALALVMDCQVLNHGWRVLSATIYEACLLFQKLYIVIILIKFFDFSLYFQVTDLRPLH